MKIVKPNAELISHENRPVEELIEEIGRICYKSENKNGWEDTVKFVNDLLKRKHFAMLEHEKIYIGFENEEFNKFYNQCFLNNISIKYFDISYCDHEEDFWVISSNIRGWKELIINYMKLIDKNEKELFSAITKCLYQFNYSLFKETENIWELYPTLIFEKPTFDKDGVRLLDRNIICTIFDDPVISKHLVHTIKFTIDRGISHEFVRHRNCAFAQESTRYCNYMKNKFGNEITVIDPFFFDEEPHMQRNKDGEIDEFNNRWVWELNMRSADIYYFDLLADGATPQEARSILPNSLKTELVITATEEEWQHIVDLRYHGTTGSPHPQMKEVMDIAYPILVKESNGRIK